VRQMLRSLRVRVPLSLIELALRPLPPFVGGRTIGVGLRLAGAGVGTSTMFWGMPRLTGSHPDLAANLEIGELCGLNFGCHFELDAKITLADHVAIGHEVTFLTRSRNAENPTERGRDSEAKPIRVEAGAWIGSRVTLLPGVTVGAGAVVGASVVVREDVPPNTLVAGTRKISLARWRGK
jgi:maltose O-acetyltransferase